MKRLALLLFTILSFALWLASCQPTHEHSVSYTDILQEASCTNEGIEADYCECGAPLYWRYPPKTEHEYVETVDHGMEPTCREVGYTPILYCKYCDLPDYSTRVEIAMLEHDIEFYCDPRCKSCGFYYPEFEIDHTYDNEYDSYCNVCESPRYTEECPHANIDVIEEEIKPTCEEDGYTLRGYCTDCKTDIYPTVIDKLGHEWDDGVITTSSTCLEEGVKTFTCTRGCERTETVALSDHDYDSDNYCTVCSIHKSTLELKYTSNGDGTCSVSKGSCTLSKIVIPENSPAGDRVVAIGYNAFIGLSGTIVIPASVTSINSSAFESFDGWFEVSNESTSYKAIDGSLYSYDEKALVKHKYVDGDEIVIPEGVTTIEDYAIQGVATNCITIPESVTYIGYKAISDSKIQAFNFYVKDATYIADTAFQGVTKTRSVNIKNLEDWLNLPMGAGPMLLGVELYCNRESMSTVEIPSTVTSIRNGAFYDCSNLRKVTFAEGSVCTSIGNEAFANCEYLRSIELPDSITSIGDYAFYYCENLTSITLPVNVTYIGEYAFYNCTSLKSIVIPFGVWTINKGTFRSCIALTDVYYTGRKEEWNMIEIADSFNDDLLNATIHYDYVPEE